MASKKKESEGIALLSMYGDEDDDMEDSDNSNNDNILEEQSEVVANMEAEEGEIVAAGRVMFAAELQTVNGTTTSNTQSTPPTQSSDAYRGNEICSEAEEAVNKEMDKFLPPPPMSKCSDELQEKITKFLLLKKKSARSFNSEVRNRKEYRNPDFLLHAVSYQGIDQIGSCFSKHVFDPHAYHKADYYDEIEADLKRELERKEQEKKKNQKILYGGTQIPTPKIMPIQGRQGQKAS